MSTPSVTLTNMGSGRTVTLTSDDAKRISQALGATAGRSRGAKIGQADIEDPDKAGVHPAQAEREAVVGGIATDRLRSIVERIERLEEERKSLGSDIKDIYAEAKSAGFDTKVLRALIAIRKREPAEVEEQETLLDLYRSALGM